MMNGKFIGFDLINLLKNTQVSVESLVSNVAQKLATSLDAIVTGELGKWKSSPTTGAFTPFNSITASATINGGIVKNSDLAVTHPDYSIKGNGTLNLVNDTIQYQASLLLNKPAVTNNQIANYLLQTPLSVSIQGNINDPSIRPDMKTYLNGAMQIASKEVVKTLINNTLNNAVDQPVGKVIQQLIPGL